MRRIIITEAQYKALVKESEGVNPLKMTFITFGLGNEYQKDKGKDVTISPEWKERLRFNNKPVAFWSCALKPEGGSDWSEWIRYEAPSWIDDLSSHFIFKLAPSAKVLVVNSKEMVDMLPKVPNRFSDGGLMSVSIDWDSLQKYWDAVFVTSDIIHAYRYVRANIPSFYSWDVESLCVFNRDVIVPIKEDIYDFDHNEGDYSDTESSWGGEEERDAIKKYQINKMYKQYGNLNTEPDMSKFFKGEHPAMMAQKHGNSKDVKKARNFKGSLK